MVKQTDLFSSYLPSLSAHQVDQLNSLEPMYQEWNEKINVISRKDMENVNERHILHSLSIYKYVKFVPGASILDLGTGGGFPGVPLAICCPETQFTLIDARRKKLSVIDDICRKADIKNVRTVHTRVEDHKGRYDFVVSRAVAPLSKLFNWSRRFYPDVECHAIPNGLIALKGGDLKAEIKALGKGQYVENIPLHTIWSADLFPDKSLVYVQA